MAAPGHVCHARETDGKTYLFENGDDELALIGADLHLN